MKILLLFGLLCCASALDTMEDRVSKLEKSMEEMLKLLKPEPEKLSPVKVKENVNRQSVSTNNVDKDSNMDGAIAFHVAMSEGNPIVPLGGSAVFDVVNINRGGGYNSETGYFTTPAGGSGLYFFYLHYNIDNGELHGLNIRRNFPNEEGAHCQAYEDKRSSGSNGQASCGALVELAEGDTIVIVHEYSGDNTPISGSNNYQTTWSGFRVSPV